jgi:hypothetical protein
LIKLGVSLEIVVPGNHLSNQNLVDSPLPNDVSTAILKRDVHFVAPELAIPPNVVMH